MMTIYPHECQYKSFGAAVAGGNANNVLSKNWNVDDQNPFKKQAIQFKSGVKLCNAECDD